MIFQSLDDKGKCVGIYHDGNLSFEPEFNKLTKTWGYASFLRDYPIEYASLYCNGKSIDQVCPDELRQEWEKASNKLRSFLISFQEAKVDLNDNCFFDLVPKKSLLELCEIKNKITKYVFANFPRPKNYEFFHDLMQLTGEMSHSELNIDTSVLKNRMAEFKVRQFVKKIGNSQPRIKYNIFGTRTGRLTTKKNSFPILTLDKNYRKILKPNNDWFVELDYNAAELRVLLGLLGKEQPRGDLHEWNVENVYNGTVTREEAKKRIFAWLYNPNFKDKLSSSIYNRGKVVKKYYDGEQVKTHFGREISADDYHALNYIIQSTTSDMILRKAIKVDKLLKGRKTNIAFMVHDSIVLDMTQEDECIIKDIFDTFANTEFGRFDTSAKAGKNFGELNKLWIHS
jgi:hypothetical protein